VPEAAGANTMIAMKSRNWPALNWCLCLAAVIALGRAGVPAARAQTWQYGYDAAGNLLVEAAATSGPPQITCQPQVQVLEPGELATFSVIVADLNGVTFQWQLNGVNLAGATRDTLLLPNPSVADLGQYSVLVSNRLGSVTRAVAWLAGNKTWNGSVSADWFNPANWTPPGAPAPNDEVTFRSGTINLTAPVTISGQFNWFGGSLGGNALTIASNALVNLAGGVKYSGVPLTNAGTVTWAGGNFYARNSSFYGYSGAVENLPGALWEIQTDQGMQNDYDCCGAMAPYFHNAGTLRKSGGQGATTLSIPLYNTGVFLTMTSALPVQLLSPQVSGGNFSLSFQTVNGRSYTLLTIKDLASGNWGSFTNVIGDGAVRQFTGQITNAGPRLFFRVREP